MKNKSSTAELKIAIQQLKEKQTNSLQSLIKQFHLTYESLKPVNLLKSTISEVVSSPILLDNILLTSVGLATGYLSKKLVVGKSDNKFRKIFGSVLQFGVTKLVNKNPETIIAIAKFIRTHIPHKKKQIDQLT
jgi:hypothetical protein